MGNEMIDYLYLLEIIPVEKEIIITRCSKLLWNLMPISDEAFNEMLKNYPGYKICEVEEHILREQGDLKNYMNPN